MLVVESVVLQNTSALLEGIAVRRQVEQMVVYESTVEMEDEEMSLGIPETNLFALNEKLEINLPQTLSAYVFVIRCSYSYVGARKPF